MKLFRQNLDTINRLLVGLANDPDRAVKAYSLGMLSMIAEERGFTAPDALLEAAASCVTLEETRELCGEFADAMRGGE